MTVLPCCSKLGTSVLGLKPFLLWADRSAVLSIVVQQFQTVVLSVEGTATVTVCIFCCMLVWSGVVIVRRQLCLSRIISEEMLLCFVRVGLTVLEVQAQMCAAQQGTAPDVIVMFKCTCCFGKGV